MGGAQQRHQLRLSLTAQLGTLTAHSFRTIRTMMDDYGSITFTRGYAEGILLVAEERFGRAFAQAQPGQDLDFLRALVPYVWAHWR